MELTFEFNEFLKEKKFDFVESKFQGRVEIYSSDFLTLRIVQDRNLFKSVEISGKEDPDNWFSLNIIRSFILSNEDYLLALNFEVGLHFLIEYFNVVLGLFLPENYFSTVISLKKLEDKRAEIKYGKL